MTTQSQSLRLATELAFQPYVWPGGYPRYAITDDGLPLCSNCCLIERTCIGTTTGSDGWCVTSLAVNWENPDLHCANCSQQIESAYVDDGDPNGGEECLTAAERNPSLCR